MLHIPTAFLIDRPESNGPGVNQRCGNCHCGLGLARARQGVLPGRILHRQRQYLNFVIPGLVQGHFLLVVDEILEQYPDVIDEWQSYCHVFLLVDLISDRGTNSKQQSIWHAVWAQTCGQSVRHRTDEQQIFHQTAKNHRGTSQCDNV